MTMLQKDNLRVGECFESPNGYIYKFLGFSKSPSQPYKEHLLLQRQPEGTDRTIHYSAQPFSHHIITPVKSTQGNPYGNSRTIF